MNIKKILENLDPFTQCRRHHLKAIECPGFLFILMGLLTLLAMSGTYLLAEEYYNPEVVVSSVSLVAIIIFVLGNFIIRGVEKMTETAIIKNEFISVVSHQLKSPLTNFKWPLELLAAQKLGALNEKQLAYLKDLQENNNRMIKLVNDLLDVSRIEDGRMKIKPQNINLEKIARLVAKDFSNLAKANNVEIVLNADENLPLVNVDPDRIRSVIQNLVDNAVKYSKSKGKIKIILKQERNKFCFRIKDSGVGIPRKQQKQIFTKFFRSDNVLKRQTEGTGLGLFIVKAIIQSSGGKIGFFSEENKGTTFWFSLPIAKE
jgi:signal transduction histidine kinase